MTSNEHDNTVTIYVVDGGIPIISHITYHWVTHFFTLGSKIYQDWFFQSIGRGDDYELNIKIKLLHNIHTIWTYFAPVLHCSTQRHVKKKQVWILIMNTNWLGDWVIGVPSDELKRLEWDDWYRFKKIGHSHSLLIVWQFIDKQWSFLLVEISMVTIKRFFKHKVYIILFLF